uniref:Glycosyltransferase n=1 Tax=Aegilops tauschii subsp. strangulata TaxID=200361 RepID=A0A453M1Q9_AEGTS
PAMAVHDEPLHILFFPFLASGHLIPIADMAALFAGRGVRCTILTTPVNAAIIRSAVDRANDAFAGAGSPAIDIAVVPFPDVGLPPGVENGTALKSQDDRDKFYHAVRLLREPFDRFLANHRTDAVVSDSFFQWSVDAAAERGVPRIAFLGSSMFARACSDSMVFNSFHDLEPDYVEHFQKTLGRRVWLVGPVALASKDMAVRGTDVPSPDAGSCLRWLDAKPSGSVVYVSFGTLTKFAPAEMHQLARALDLSGVNFVWVIGAAAGQDSSEWMPEGFADLIASGDRGFMVRGWAPQMLVLSHPALGGFVTHCGWNSVLEAVTAGVPMVTWPRYADQFNNEKLVVELLKVGVSIGAKDYASGIQAHEVIAGEVIAESIQRLMEGDDIQKKAKDLGLKARSAVEKGGSSYDDVGRLMDVLTARRSSV